MGARRGKGGAPVSSLEASSVPFWHTSSYSLRMSISNRYLNNPCPLLSSPATACPSLLVAEPAPPRVRETQWVIEAIFRLLASRCTAGASFTIRGRNFNRSDTAEGCSSTLLFMQPQQLLSIPFPRATRPFHLHALDFPSSVTVLRRVDRLWTSDIPPVFPHTIVVHPF